MTSTYADLKTSFLPHPVTGDITLVTDVDAIKQSVINVVFTDFYERYYNPVFGAGVPQNLFENITPQTKFEIENRIKQAINNFEPRATLVRVLVVPQSDNNNITVTITFRPINNTQDVSVNRILRRLR